MQHLQFLLLVFLKFNTITFYILDCFSDIVISNINEVAVYWYTSDLFWTNGSVYLFLALSKSKVDIEKLQKMFNGEISNTVVVEAVSVPVKTVALLHQKLVKIMLLVGLQGKSSGERYYTEIQTCHSFTKQLKSVNITAFLIVTHIVAKYFFPISDLFWLIRSSERRV